MELLKRVGVALFWIPIIVYFILEKGLYNIPLFLFLLAVGLIGSFEFNRMLRIKGSPIQRYAIIISNFFIFSAALFVSLNSSMLWLLYGTTIFIIFIFFLPQVFKNEFKDVFKTNSSFLLLIFYLPFMTSHLLLLKGLPNGSYFLFLIILMVWANDSFAYIIGMLFGRKNLLGLKSSPNKSYAGLFGGIIFSIISIFITNYLFGANIKFNISVICYDFHTNFIFNRWWSILIGLLFGVIAFFSDLIESIFKRSVQLKDSDNFLPGHGGILDVFDSTIFTTAIFYYFILFLRFINIIDF